MTISDAIKKMNDLADIGIVNAKEDAEALRETAKILYRLRERLDPRWNEWLIMDEGHFLAAFHDGESEWTENKDGAIAFEKQEDAEAYLDQMWEKLGDGIAVLRGDIDAYGMSIIFDSGESWKLTE